MCSFAPSLGDDGGVISSWDSSSKTEVITVGELRAPTRASRVAIRLRWHNLTRDPVVMRMQATRWVTSCDKPPTICYPASSDTSYLSADDLFPQVFEAMSVKSRKRSDYSYFLDYRTRWSDNDQYGHVSNTIYNIL